MVEQAEVTHTPTGPEAPEPQDDKPQVPAKFIKEDGSVDVDGLARSYSELEKKQGAASEKPEDTDTGSGDESEKPETDDGDDKTKEEGEDVKPDVSYGTAIDSVITAAGLTPEAVNEEYQKDGKLSDATMEALEKQGFSRDVINHYVKGFEAQAAEATAKFDNAVFESVGGNEAWDEVKTWAEKGGATSEDAEAFNKAAETGDIEKATEISKKWTEELAKETGQDPKRHIDGDRTASPQDVFENHQQAMRAMREAKKSGDPAAVKAVEQKALRSPNL